MQGVLSKKQILETAIIGSGIPGGKLAVKHQKVIFSVIAAVAAIHLVVGLAAAGYLLQNQIVDIGKAGIDLITQGWDKIPFGTIAEKLQYAANISSEKILEGLNATLSFANDNPGYAFLIAAGSAIAVGFGGRAIWKATRPSESMQVLKEFERAKEGPEVSGFADRLTSSLTELLGTKKGRDAIANLMQKLGDQDEKQIAFANAYHAALTNRAREGVQKLEAFRDDKGAEGSPLGEALDKARSGDKTGAESINHDLIPAVLDVLRSEGGQQILDEISSAIVDQNKANILSAAIFEAGEMIKEEEEGN